MGALCCSLYMSINLIASYFGFIIVIIIVVVIFEYIIIMPNNI